ncbi:MAG TPA: hypothetical protein VGT81_03485, partial [Casimicrobiaceae bacterium]|nr:hypothetical protein [Casimicrobiaceae bacterium]
RHDTCGNERASANDETTTGQLVVTSWSIMPIRKSSVTIVNHGARLVSAAIGLMTSGRSIHTTLLAAELIAAVNGRASMNWYARIGIGAQRNGMMLLPSIATAALRCSIG